MMKEIELKYVEDLNEMVSSCSTYLEFYYSGKCLVKFINLSELENAEQLIEDYKPNTTFMVRVVHHQNLFDDNTIWNAGEEMLIIEKAFQTNSSNSLKGYIQIWKDLIIKNGDEGYKERLLINLFGKKFADIHVKHGILKHLKYNNIKPKINEVYLTNPNYEKFVDKIKKMVETMILATFDRLKTGESFFEMKSQLPINYKFGGGYFNENILPSNLKDEVECNVKSKGKFYVVTRSAEFKNKKPIDEFIVDVVKNKEDKDVLVFTVYCEDSIEVACSVQPNGDLFFIFTDDNNLENQNYIEIDIKNDLNLYGTFYINYIISNFTHKFTRNCFYL